METDDMPKTVTEQPLISVILDNYNYGQFIAEAIFSVLEQTYTNFELIIVDDGSTDNSREIIASYDDVGGHLISGGCGQLK